jgi:hypothetical protein
MEPGSRTQTAVTQVVGQSDSEPIYEKACAETVVIGGAYYSFLHGSLTPEVATHA